MSALRGNSLYGRMIERLGHLPLNISCWIRDLKTKEMWNEAVDMDPYSLAYVPHPFKTEEMCKEGVSREPYTLRYVPDHFRTQEMCIEAVEEDPWLLECVSDRLKHKKCAIKQCAWIHGC